MFHLGGPSHLLRPPRHVRPSPRFDWGEHRLAGAGLRARVVHDAEVVEDLGSGAREELLLAGQDGQKSGVKMVSRQLELALGRMTRPWRSKHRGDRSSRAGWWFERMHKVVDRALDWELAPSPPENSPPASAPANSESGLGGACATTLACLRADPRATAQPAPRAPRRKLRGPSRLLWE